MEFAQSLMQKHGWTAGMGLGRENTGRTSAIKVNLKFDSKGLGENGTDQFKFNWWDHMFNKAANNISVTEDGSGGVAVETTGETGTISARAPVINRQKNMFYLGFVKATDVEAEAGPASRVLHTVLTDEELLRACDGMTGHKAARHGNKLSGKLARMEQADAAFLAKYGSLDSIIQKEEQSKAPTKPKTGIAAIAAATSKAVVTSMGDGKGGSALANGSMDKHSKKLRKRIGREPTAAELAKYVDKKERKERKRKAEDERQSSESQPQPVVEGTLQLM